MLLLMFNEDRERAIPIESYSRNLNFGEGLNSTVISYAYFTVKSNAPAGTVNQISYYGKHNIEEISIINYVDANTETIIYTLDDFTTGKVTSVNESITEDNISISGNIELRG